MKKMKSVILCTWILTIALLTACVNGNTEITPDTQTIHSNDTSSPTPAATASVVPNITSEQPAVSPIATDVPQIHTILAYVICDPSAVSLPGERILLLVDEVLWIDGEDEETLSRYGISLDEVSNDYAIVNEIEEWETYIATDKTMFFVQYDQDYNINPREISMEAFAQYLLEIQEYGILAEVTISGNGENEVMRIEEIYTP